MSVAVGPSPKGYADSAALLNGALCAGLEPTPDLTISQWAETYRTLSSKGSAEPGPFRLDRVPYQQAIMDVCGPQSRIEKVVIIKGVQLGLTDGVLVNVLGYYIHLAPSPLLFVLPTESSLKRNHDQKIQPLLDTAVIRARVLEGTQRAKTSEKKTVFLGGMLACASAESPSDARNFSARVLILDDCDEFPQNLADQGDACALMEGRASAFHNCKIIYNSTPTTVEKSRVAPLYEQSDQRKYWVPCPECGLSQTLVFGGPLREEASDTQGLFWAAGCPETAHYRCACGARWRESQKLGIMQHGEWRARYPERQIAGFHISSLYSVVGYTWARLAQDFEDAQKNPAKMITFRNIRLAETTKTTQAAPDHITLYERRSAYPLGTVPEGAEVLFSASDIQGNRIEYDVYGWGPNMTRYLVDHRVFEGETSDPNSGAFLELSDYLDRWYPHETGGQLKVARIAMDSGYRTQVVYNWVRKHPHAMAVDGLADGRRQRPILGSGRSKAIREHGRMIKNGVVLWPVGTHAAKLFLYTYLERMIQVDEPFYGRVYFPMDVCVNWMKQLVAEERRIIRKGGRMAVEWRTRPGSPRNEALDMAVYNHAAALREGVDHWSAAKWVQLRQDRLKSASKEDKSGTKETETPEYWGEEGTENYW